MNKILAFGLPAVNEGQSVASLYRLGLTDWCQIRGLYYAVVLNMATVWGPQPPNFSARLPICQS